MPSCGSTSVRDSLHMLYAGLSRAVSRVVRAGHGILVYYPPEGLKAGSELSSGLVSRIGVFVEALEDLEEAIDQIQLDRTAKGFVGAVETGSALRYMEGTALDGQDGVALDLGELRQLVHGSKDSMRLFPAETIWRAYCTMLLNGSRASVDANELESLQWIAFTGYLIFVTRPRKDDDGYVVISPGLAMLHDLYFGIPSAQVIVDYLQGMNGGGENGSGASETVRFEFDRSMMLGVEFANGLNRLKGRLDLTLMKISEEERCSSV